MTKADRVLSTPPTNTSATNPKSSRRGFLVHAAGVAAGGAAIGAGLPLPVAGFPTAAAPALDAELVELGRKYELLLDKFFPAHRDWSRGAALAGAEQDAEFCLPKDRGYRYTQEMSAAHDRRLEDTGASQANDRMDAATLEMEPIEHAINCLPVSSIEGLRAKALIALHEIRPVIAGETEYDFQNEVAFQQLFTAVAELCGLKGKMAATGYELPDIGMVEAAPDDDSDDDGEDA
jgi:hypothetical protein